MGIVGSGGQINRLRLKHRRVSGYSRVIRPADLLRTARVGIFPGLSRTAENRLFGQVFRCPGSPGNTAIQPHELPAPAGAPN